MGIEIKIDATDALDAQQQMVALLAGFPAALADVSAEPEVKPAKRSSRKATESKAEEQEPGNAATSSMDESTPSSGTGSTTTEAGPSAQEAEVTYADVQKAVTALAAAKGRDAVVDVFSMFGVDHGTKLKPDQWPEAIAELTKAKGE